METDIIFMRRALSLARQAAQEGEVPVGCVITHNGTIVGEGYNRREQDKNALRHAELIAIENACRHLGGWRLHQCDLYVTLEPCPMCAGAAVNARLHRLVFGASDPKAGACGSRLSLFDYGLNHTPLISQGLLAAESAALLRSFFTTLRATTIDN